MFRIFDGKKTQVYGWHIFKLIFYYVTPPSPPSHLEMLDYVSRKIPRFALGINTAPPALILCRCPCGGMKDGSPLAKKTTVLKTRSFFHLSKLVGKQRMSHLLCQQVGSRNPSWAKWCYLLILKWFVEANDFQCNPKIISFFIYDRGGAGQGEKGDRALKTLA